MNEFTIAIICGGPSYERGVSLNSARSLLDHLDGLDVKVKTIYVNQRLEFFSIDKSQLYSNTPSDFDFKLCDSTRVSDLVAELKLVDLVFPVIHGKYGEDGTIQGLLEENNIPFIGSSSDSCRKMYSKLNINRYLIQNSMDHTEMIAIHKNDKRDHLESFVEKHQQVIVKPDKAGSSIGVSPASNFVESQAAVDSIFNRDIDDVAIVEEFCKGREFTVIVIQNSSGEPVSLIPTEIEILSGDKIFNYRKKYLPTNSTRWHCPPRFETSTIVQIMEQAEKMFIDFQMRDFVRIDGWVLSDGRLVFSDTNPISGMEQNSFIFQQGAYVGLTHRDMLKSIIDSACRRYDISSPGYKYSDSQETVHILLGGNSAERQVSLMSGTNVWLKLLYSKQFKPVPCLLNNDEVWILPYQYGLSHTVEEILGNCEDAEKNEDLIRHYRENVRNRLGLSNYTTTLPTRFALNDFLDMLMQENKFVFLGLHGGIGEDGSMQKLLEDRGIKHNGSNSSVSKLCMDKYSTSKFIAEQNIEHVISLKQKLCRFHDGVLCDVDSLNGVTFDSLCLELNANDLIIKPSNDGCSAGVARISSQSDLNTYAFFASSDHSIIPGNSLAIHNGIIELPHNASQKSYIIEPFIRTDSIKIDAGKLYIEKIAGWIELTAAVLEDHGQYKCLNPSITVADNNILSIEEKFQGGTGVNITPPPSRIISEDQCNIIKDTIEKVASAVGIGDYCRIDLFFNRETDEIIVIEINTLPALTPSTVLFHQLLSEERPIYPRGFIENLIFKQR